MVSKITEAKITQKGIAGSWTTPGNGHDLCLLSGFVAAHALGASYPFANDKDLCAEFERARGVLGQ